MTWIVGIDEAGYGPNLGPFVMSAVACRVDDALAGSCLWKLLKGGVRKCSDKNDSRLLVDDSKAIYSAGKGLTGLERGLYAVLDLAVPTLDELLRQLSPVDHGEVATEVWYTGRTTLPADTDLADLMQIRERFSQTCAATAVTDWHILSAVVCPWRFNTLVDQTGSKSFVLADAFIRLLQRGLSATAGQEALEVFVDKQGGRNTYAAQIQQALPGGFLEPKEESMARSSYRVHGLGRSMALTFQPRADQEHFCVALASMASKYLRELFMGEFNRFWQSHVPGLKATAGYPGDALRFLEAIRPAASALKIPETAIWRQK
jgi:ribonuclease HII